MSEYDHPARCEHCPEPAEVRDEGSGDWLCPAHRCTLRRGHAGAHIIPVDEDCPDCGQRLPAPGQFHPCPEATR